jgi:hypothetical protein
MRWRCVYTEVFTRSARTSYTFIHLLYTLHMLCIYVYPTEEKRVDEK